VAHNGDFRPSKNPAAAVLFLARSLLSVFLAGSFLPGTLAAASANGPFAPFEEWKNAVAAGDQAALARLYSTHPPAAVQVGRNPPGTLPDELRFWSSLRDTGITAVHPKVLESEFVQGQRRLLLRIEAGRNLVASMLQVWANQPDGWRMVASRRTEFTPGPPRTLPQPAVPNTALYSDPGDAEAELKAALLTAGKEHKRVLVVFGANWCYDCHVLDTTFHSPEFAPLVDSNYVVVHISIGDEGKDNHDLAARMGVALDHGVPSLAVLDPDGKVVVAQKNGEFESTVKIGPADVRAFLEKWRTL